MRASSLWMRFGKQAVSALAALLPLAALAGPPQSPYDMALTLERAIASGAGILMPDPAQPYTCCHGTLPLPPPDEAGFPQGFLDGLAGVEEYGVTVYPVTARVDDASGHTVFRNAEGVAFWAITPAGAYDPGWVCRLRGGANSPLAEGWVAGQDGVVSFAGSGSLLRTALLLLPSHVEARWAFAAGPDVKPHNDAHRAALAQSRAVSRPADPPRQLSTTVPQIRITSFTAGTDMYTFSAEWNHLMKFPLSMINVLFSESLSDPDWCVIGALENVPSGVAGATNFVVLAEDLPYREPAVAHGPGCAPVTNIVFSTLDPGLAYTNVTCNCPAVESPQGFFKLAPVEGGGWWDDDGWEGSDPPPDFDNDVSAGWGTWVPVWTHPYYSTTPLKRSGNLWLTPGQTYIVAVYTHSEWYPLYTANPVWGPSDRLKWQITCPDGHVISGDINVHDRHNDWIVDEQNGISLSVNSQTFFPAHMEAFHILHVPEGDEGTRAGGGLRATPDQVPIGYELEATNGVLSRRSWTHFGVFPLKIIQENMPNPENNFNSTDMGHRRTASIDTGPQAIAYITGDPAPPKLKAVFDQLPDHVKVDWSLSIKTERPDARKDGIDDRGPFITNNVPGDVEWNITQAMTNEIIGGECTLKAKVTYRGDTLHSTNKTFYIRGKNPKDADVKNFINLVIPVNLRTGALFMAMHESKQATLDGTKTWRIFNQFNCRNMTSPTGVLTLCGTPNMTAKKNENETTDGWGIGQITTTTYADGIVKTPFVWNWKEHIWEMGVIMTNKLATHNEYMRFYKNAYGVTPPATFTYKGATLAPAEWGVAGLYNGKGGIKLSKAKDDKGKDILIRSPMAYVNGKWVICENKQKYVQKIAETKKDVDSGKLKIKE